MPNPLLANRQLGPNVARANLLINGGMEVWQRGNGPYSGGISADMWGANVTGGDTVTITREQSVIQPGSASSMKVVVVRSAGTNTNIAQQLDQADGFKLAGLTVSLSARVQANAANAVRLLLSSDGTGSAAVQSAYHPGDGTWQTLTATSTLPSDETVLYAGSTYGASVTAYLDNLCLVVGAQPANYVPVPPGDDLQRCLRYYQIWNFAGADQPLCNAQCVSTAGVYGVCPHKAPMAATPSMTCSNNTFWGVWQANSTRVVAVTPPAAYFMGPDRATYSLTASGLVAGNATQIVAAAAGAYLVLAANP